MKVHVFGPRRSSGRPRVAKCDCGLANRGTCAVGCEATIVVKPGDDGFEICSVCYARMEADGIEISPAEVKRTVRDRLPVPFVPK